jgi:glucose/arabinose dehydrogenase
LVIAFAVATACSSSEPAATPTPTVPTVASTTGPTAGEEGVVPSGTDVEGPGTPDSGEEPTHLTPTTTGSTPAGDLGAVQIRLEEIAVLEEPLAMTTVPGDSHLWIAGRQGQVVRLNPTTGEVAGVVLDLHDDTVGSREQGLLGIAADETHLYVDYTDLNGDTRVEAYTLTDEGVDPDSRRELISQEQPFGNHNGGGLLIDEDGYLYIGLGDGGSAGDPLGAGQDPNTWLGSILRIDPDPDGVEPYSIPPGNPFTDGTDGLPEIFLTGVRNPWRFSLDRVTGDLWIGDVGQDAYEEITLLLAANGGGAGANLGWSLREGLHQFRGPAPEGHIEPVWEYGHDDGVSVTGGYVYRGSAIPELYGNYVFGDYQTARLWALGVSTGEVVFRDLDAPVPGGNLASFGEGPEGELYVMSLAGPVSRILPAR